MSISEENINAKLASILSKLESKVFRKQYSTLAVRKIDQLIAKLDDGDYHSLSGLSQIVKKKHPKLSRRCLNFGHQMKAIPCSFALAQSLFMNPPLDLPRSFKLIRSLAQDEKYSHAAFLLANIYNPYSDLNLRAENPFVEHSITSLSLKHSLWWHKMAADYSPQVPLYQYTLAEIVFKGEIVMKNTEFAKDYYRKIVKRGRESISKSKKGGVPRSPKKAASPSKRKRVETRVDDLNFLVVCSLLRLSKIFRSENETLARRCILESEKFGNKEFKEHLKILERLIGASKMKEKPHFKPRYKLDNLLEEVGMIELPSDEIPEAEENPEEDDEEEEEEMKIVLTGPTKNGNEIEDILDGLGEDRRPNPPPPTPQQEGYFGGQVDGGVNETVIRDLLKEKKSTDLLDIRYLSTPDSPEKNRDGN